VTSIPPVPKDVSSCPSEWLRVGKKLHCLAEFSLADGILGEKLENVSSEPGKTKLSDLGRETTLTLKPRATAPWIFSALSTA
jgi:hypothetical protein